MTFARRLRSRLVGKMRLGIPWLLYFAGLASIVYGCGLIYRPAGFIVGGLLSFVLSMLLVRPGADSE